MNFYEVILGIANGSRKIGKVIVPVQAKSRFEAALAAEEAVEDLYGENVYGHSLKVTQAQPGLSGGIAA